MVIKIPEERRVEFQIKKVVSINNSASGSVSIPIPQGVKAYLKGYGYSYADSCEFVLSTGNLAFPKRTDQEGNATQPRIFENAFEIRSGGECKLSITNNSGGNVDFEVLFYIIADTMLEGPAYESVGGELTIPTSVTSTIASNVQTTSGSVTSLPGNETANGAALGSIEGLMMAGSDGSNARFIATDSSGNVQVDVLSTTSDTILTNIYGDTTAILADTASIDTSNAAIQTAVEALQNNESADTPSHAKITIATGNTSEAALASNGTRRCALLQNISDTAMYIKIGASAVDQEGIYLAPNGGGYEISAKYGNLSTDAINVICATSGKILLVTEWD